MVPSTHMSTEGLYFTLVDRGAPVALRSTQAFLDLSLNQCCDY